MYATTLQSILAAASGTPCSVHLLDLDDIVDHHDVDHHGIDHHGIDHHGVDSTSGAARTQLHTHHAWKAPTSGAAALVFTSGTTGPSKAVVLPHSALVFQSHAKMVWVVCSYCWGD